MIRNICICGAGTMGSGIAQLAASSALPVILYELNSGVLEKAKKTIDNNLQLLVEKGKINPGQKEKIFQSVHFTNDLNECVADVIIEAIIENIDAKIHLFNQLAAINDDKTIFATNTSSLSVTSIASKILQPERFLGMHFFNPAPIMKLVEVINTNYTNKQITQVVTDLARQMGKVPVVCKDSPGFIVNRVARPYYIESLRLVEEGHVSLETIDVLLEGSGFKLGPFKLMDLIGNDINYSVSCSVYEQLNKPERLMPSAIQKEKVEKGELGKKTGKGYYRYN
ncbi:MAG TPA: 3-hydroxyacyl-CoA dehydrogenase NAD-binding domain-containing protein [Chitinophagaceae bacterium]|nr:3-hydroxyacyl-CoA dehydrogenase NAD-binding domain-containing protein [Chitinophagaceae bacterium]